MTVKISHNYSFVSGNITHTTGNTNAATTRMISENSFKVLTPIFFFFNLFWLCWVFVSVRGLSLVAESGGHSSLRCAGLSLSRPLLLRRTGSRCTGSVVVAHGPSCSAACGILPDQGSNPCPLHWQADSQPLHHQGSPHPHFYSYSIFTSVELIALLYHILFHFILCCLLKYS